MKKQYFVRNLLILLGAVLPVTLIGCQQGVCDGVEGSCLDLRVEGPDSAILPFLQIRLGTQKNLGVPDGIPLPYNIQVAPADVAVGDINFLQVFAGSGLQDIQLCAEIKSFHWQQGTHIKQTLTLSPCSDCLKPSAMFARQDISVGRRPFSVRTGDFNQDRKPDLAVVNSAGNSISILFGDGRGAFSAGPELMGFATPAGVRVQDLDGDKLDDLIVTNNGSTNVSVLLGRGNGIFAPIVNYSTYTVAGNNPGGMVVTDLDGDGISDIAVSHSALGSTTGSLFLGQPLGKFGPASALASMPLGLIPGQMDFGDINGDGATDLVVASYSDGTINTLLSSKPFSAFTVGTSSFKLINAGVKLVDVNNDNHPDMIATSYAAGDFQLFINNGNAFPDKPSQIISSFGGIAASDGKDLNSDGKMDIIVADYTNAAIKLLYGKGDGILADPITIASCVSSFSLYVQDFNNDLKPDIVVVNKENNSISILLNQM